jgi:DNA-binding LacI/PurR family transcriptional regulator
MNGMPSDTASERLLAPPLRERALAHMRRMVSGHVLRPGRQLPSERVLAAELGVGRTVVRGVLESLEHEGLVRHEGRRAWFVAAPPTPSPVSLLAGTVAVVVGEEFLGPHAGLGEPGWSYHLFRGVADRLLARGCHLFTLTGRGLDAAMLGRLVASPPLGVIVVSEPPGLTSRAEILRTLHLNDIAVAAYGDVHEWPGCDVVVSDHAAGAAALTRWLAARGCRRILPCWVELPQPASWLARREAGHLRACQALGLTPLAPFVIPPAAAAGDGAAARFAAAARACADSLAPHLRGPDAADALLVVSDGLVFQLAAAARLLGRVPNADLALVGYDNYWREAPDRALVPDRPLATVDKDNYRIGRELAERILARAAEGQARAPRRLVVRPRLIETEVSEARPGRVRAAAAVS